MHPDLYCLPKDKIGQYQVTFFSFQLASMTVKRKHPNTIAAGFKTYPLYYDLFSDKYLRFKITNKDAVLFITVENYLDNCSKLKVFVLHVWSFLGHPCFLVLFSVLYFLYMNTATKSLLGVLRVFRFNIVQNSYKNQHVTFQFVICYILVCE